MIRDFKGESRYYDKPFSMDRPPLTPETKKVLREIASGKFIIAKEYSFVPRGYPTSSPGWNVV